MVLRFGSETITSNAAEPFVVGYLVYFESKPYFSKLPCSISFIRYEGFARESNLPDGYDMQL